jgi:hypothetical protein
VGVLKSLGVQTPGLRAGSFLENGEVAFSRAGVEGTERRERRRRRYVVKVSSRKRDSSERYAISFA